MSIPGELPWYKGRLDKAVNDELRSTASMNPDIPLRWDDRREYAAALCAEGRMTLAQVCKAAHISQKVLQRIRTHPDFQKRVDELHREFLLHVHSRYFARREGRVASLIERLEEIEAIWNARSELLGEDDQSGGGTTGHIIKRYKSIGSGPTAEKAIEYEADVALIREYRGLQQQIAQELGHWGEKLEISGPDGGPVTVREVEVVLSTRHAIQEGEFRELPSPYRQTEEET